ncbi:amidase [Nocardia sp. NPDC003963]
MPEKFDPFEATIESIGAAYAAGTTTCVELAGYYLDRIAKFDRNGPEINSIITISPTVLEDAAELDRTYAETGPVGPLHGVPVLVKDQVDVVGMPTTLGSVLLRDHYPDSDGVVVRKLKEAGALILAKTTLGELAGGDAHGSLFGSTRNPYDLERTPGGSSGGSGAAVAANFGAVSVAQEGLASIRRPAAWNSCVGMRPSLGLVSRTGTYGCWPSKSGSLGPITRTVTDAAAILDTLAGFDPEDPSTAWGVGQMEGTFVSHLDANALSGARIGIIREVIGLGSDPAATDFARSRTVFDAAIGELASAGAQIVDPLTIENLLPLLAKRAFDSGKEAFESWMGRNANPPYRSHEDFVAEEQYRKAMWLRGGGRPSPWQATYEEYLAARDDLRTNMLVAMAEHELDAIVHITVEHTPTLITDGVNAPYVNMKGAPHINTFLYDVPSMTVPAGFTEDRLPVGITFLGRPYSDQRIVSLAYAYEQATAHRVPPASTPA